jgi:hypothetical protein
MVNGGHIRHLHIVLWRAPPGELVSEIDKDVLEAFFGSEVLAGRDNSNRNRGNKPVGTDGCINDAVLGLKDIDNTAAAELVESQSWTQVQELMTCRDPLEFEAFEQARQEVLAQARREREQQLAAAKLARDQQWEQRCRQAQQQQRELRELREERERPQRERERERKRELREQLRLGGWQERARQRVQERQERARQ